MYLSSWVLLAFRRSPWEGFPGSGDVCSGVPGVMLADRGEPGWDRHGIEWLGI